MKSKTTIAGFSAAAGIFVMLLDQTEKLVNGTGDWKIVIALGVSTIAVSVWAWYTQDKGSKS